jgi:hypothetical protein
VPTTIRRWSRAKRRGLDIASLRPTPHIRNGPFANGPVTGLRGPGRSVAYLIRATCRRKSDVRSTRRLSSIRQEWRVESLRTHRARRSSRKATPPIPSSHSTGPCEAVGGIRNRQGGGRRRLGSGRFSWRRSLPANRFAWRLTGEDATSVGDLLNQRGFTVDEPAVLLNVAWRRRRAPPRDALNRCEIGGQVFAIGPDSEPGVAAFRVTGCTTRMGVAPTSHEKPSAHERAGQGRFREP